MNIFMRFPDGKAKAFTLSYDDGVRQDKRLVQIFNKYGLKCTFNINSSAYDAPKEDEPYKGKMSLAEMVPVYAGHEVAVHTLTHPFLEQLPSALVTREVLDDRCNIEKTFGRIARGMAYPFGTYNDNVVQCIASCGIVYCRTVRATQNFSVPEDWLRLHPTCHHADPNVLAHVERFSGNHSGRAPWLFYLWGHSYEFDSGRERNSWEYAETLFASLGGHDDVWYATNIEVYDYVQAYRRLVYSADAKTVYNPSVIEVFFACGDKTVSVKPDETVCL